MTELLKLQNQMCFPVYALAREIINHYRPMLDELELTYPQYLVLLVLWEQEKQTVNQLGEKLMLDSGTLTPLLKRLEQKGIVKRERSTADERVVFISLTEQGKALETKATCIPEQLMQSLNMSMEDMIQLKSISDKILKAV
ncbi:MarR family winged helix-turn-helix transcriptional regulator [Emticicia agri]|uniref:HTH-type transcriptional regulator SarZ n=1 Tax=Emticicia agri TaxID=2492393 RepID=A0A4Q5LVC4_9BACT|nr:MarR family transcriptional regulator [Emticicia agri]RYU93648.1 MarR family transcriptional regulator [Emticicia agri]